MDRFQGLIGILVIIIIAFLFSNNKSKINYRLVMSGLLLQFTIGVLILKIPAVTHFFQIIGCLSSTAAIPAGIIPPRPA